MPPVFGRNFPNPHPYDNVIATWRSSTEPEDHAMARNLMHDHRVSQERERAFDKLVPPSPTARNLQHAIVDYFKTKVRTRKLPHYVYTALNATNLLTGQGPSHPVINKDLKLVRVLDLNRLGLVYQWAMNWRNKKREWKRSFAKFPTAPNDDQIAKWLDDEIGGGSEKQQEQLVATVLDMINTYSPKHPFQPTWATTWSAFEPHERLGPDRWLQVLGMANPSSRWVMLLRYTVREAGTIARPTLLDAGWYADHFPSPPQAPLVVGGHPMDLRISPRATHLLPEYIHKQIQHSLKHWTDIGGKIGRTTAPNPASLADQRRTHHELLTRVYGPGVHTWMDNPM